MSKSKNAVELCALLVDGTYGELACRITTILLRRGRLTVPLLARHTNLSLRQVRHGLVVLIQQNLVYHHFEIETRLTHYEANPETAFALARSGKIMELVERKYGVSARDVIKNLLVLGNTKVADLAAPYASKELADVAGSGNTHPSMNGTNGHSKHSAASPVKLDSILIRLLSAGLVETVSERMFRSPSDTYNQVEHEILESGYSGSAKGTKQKDEVKAKIRERLQAIRSDRPEWWPSGEKRGVYGREVSLINGNGKRKRPSGVSGVANGDHIYVDGGVSLDQELVIRINYEKFTVLLRNQRLVEFAQKRIGVVTSRVYGGLLKLLEENISRCRPDPRVDDVLDLPDGPAATTTELAAVLDDTINLAIGIGKTSSDKISTKGLEKVHKTRQAEEDAGKAGNREDRSADDDVEMENDEVATHWDPISVQPYSDSEDDPFADEPITRAPKRHKVTFEDKLLKPLPIIDRQARLDHVKDHLFLLSGDDSRFLRRCGSRGFGEWTVDFDGVIERIKDAEIDLLLLENFGVNGHRLVRILRKLGKLDEKQLSNFALIKQKDVRTKMVEMQMAGIVDVQEIPRDSARSTGRSLYLWFFDIDRVSNMFLDRTYKNMSRCLQRLAIERRRAKDILELTERSDLRDAAEEDYLTPFQLNELEAIRAKEESLYCHIGRLDELVGIFRDY